MNLDEWKSFLTTSVAGVIGAYPIAWYLDIAIEKYLVIAFAGISIILLGGGLITVLDAIENA